MCAALLGTGSGLAVLALVVDFRTVLFGPRIFLLDRLLTGATGWIPKPTAAEKAERAEHEGPCSTSGIGTDTRN